VSQAQIKELLIQAACEHDSVKQAVLEISQSAESNEQGALRGKIQGYGDEVLRAVTKAVNDGHNDENDVLDPITCIVKSVTRQAWYENKYFAIRTLFELADNLMHISPDISSNTIKKLGLPDHIVNSIAAVQKTMTIEETNRVAANGLFSRWIQSFRREMYYENPQDWNWPYALLLLFGDPPTGVAAFINIENAVRQVFLPPKPPTTQDIYDFMDRTMRRGVMQPIQEQSDTQMKLYALRILLRTQWSIRAAWARPNLPFPKKVLSSRMLDASVRDGLQHIRTCSSPEDCKVFSKSQELRDVIQKLQGKCDGDYDPLALMHDLLRHFGLSPAR
jgi:hypothetical protein